MFNFQFLNSIDEWLRRLEQLDEYIQSNLMKIGAILKIKNLNYPDQEVLDLIKSYEMMRGYRKVFDYSAVIVRLYGYFENSIEDIIESYLQDLLRLVSRFEDLPVCIQRNHFSKSIELSKSLKLEKFKDRTSERKIIEILSKCYDSVGGIQPQLNTLAYTMHGSNFRFQVIDGVFKSIGIGDVHAKIIQEPSFHQYLSLEDPDLLGYSISDSRYIKRAKERIQNVLKTLADRRNEIAHGSPCELIALEEVRSGYIDFFKYYARSLSEVLKKSLMPYFINQHGHLLSNPVLFFGGSVVGFKASRLEIKIGDCIFIKISKSGNDYNIALITEIRLNRESISSMKIGEQQEEFTLKLNTKVRKDQELFLVTSQN
jgi:hypothetical protein